MRRSRIGRCRLLRGVAVAATGLLVAVGCSDAPDSTRAAGPALSLTESLSGPDTAGYARATEPRTFAFPKDHGAHPDFRTEWWYVTGNLAPVDPSGPNIEQEFGFQFTIFRNALTPMDSEGGIGSRGDPDARPGSSPRSAWATRQAFMGHFTLTDVGGGVFRDFERFARGAAGLAGATAADGAAEGDGFRVWLEDWVLQGGPDRRMTLRAAAGDVSLELDLAQGKPAVLQGDRGLSQKGSEPGNASYYYSLTRLPAVGTLVVAGDSTAVEGLAWLDREWSTSALAEGQVGWDWFSLQLDDGWDLMVYRLRRADGGADPLSEGVLVDPEGGSTRLAWGRDVTVESTATWASPIDGAEYPAAWRIRVPGRSLDLTVEPRLADQELDGAFRYWEGAVSVSGVGQDGRPVRGLGYVELTGYAASAGP